MKSRILNLLIITVWAWTVSLGQIIDSKTLSLEECIQIAIENSVDLKETSLSSQTSKINLKQKKQDRFPTVSLNYNLGLTNGRSIDPFTNDYINEQLSFSSAGLSLDAIIFNGFRLKNIIHQNEFNLEASKMKHQEIEDNLILNVTLAYLNVLNNKDLLALAQSRLGTTKKQLDRLQILYQEEVGNPSEYFDLKGQQGNDQLNVINLGIILKTAIVDLMILLNLDMDSYNNIETISRIDVPIMFPWTAQEIYADAITNLPRVKTKYIEKNALKLNIDLAKSDYYPQISFFGRLNTNYSSAAQVFSESGSKINETGDYVHIGNNDIPVLRESTLFSSDGIGYFSQLQNNLNSSFGIAVRIPIFNGYRTKNNVALAQVQIEEKDVETERTLRLLQQSIENAHLNMLSAYERYHILIDQVTAFKESFRVNEIRFNNGISNIVAYLQSKNNLENAQINLTNTRHEYHLRVKVLEYYRGNVG